MSGNSVREKLLVALKYNFLNTRVYLLGLLLLLVLISAFMVVRIKFQHREEMVALQTAEIKQEKLRIEWSQTLLEYSTLASPNRVEQVASEKLKMHLPDPLKVKSIAL